MGLDWYNRFELFLSGDGNVLELGSENDCTTLWTLISTESFF